jgi:hypothetical protein
MRPLALLSVLCTLIGLAGSARAQVRSEPAPKSPGRSIFDDDTDDTNPRVPVRPTTSPTTPPPDPAPASPSRAPPSSVRPAPHNSAFRQPIADPATYRRLTAPVRFQTQASSQALGRPPENPDKNELARWVSAIGAEIVGQHFPLPKGTQVRVSSDTWTLSGNFKVVFLTEYPNGFFGAGAHPHLRFNGARKDVGLGVWRDDGDPLPSPAWILKRFVNSPPSGCAPDPARAVHLLRRWLDLYHDDPGHYAGVDDCYSAIAAAYAADNATRDLPLLLDAELKMDRGPRSAYAIHSERARHYHEFLKDDAKAIESFEKARVVAKANAEASAHFVGRVPLVDLNIAKMLFKSDKARAARYARAAYEDAQFGRNQPMISGNLLGDIYEAQGDLAAARRLYGEILNHRYPNTMAQPEIDEIKTHFRGRLERLRQRGP